MDLAQLKRYEASPQAQFKELKERMEQLSFRISEKAERFVAVTANCIESFKSFSCI